MVRRSVFITFDDGYADLAHAAFPLLRSAGLSATVFVVTGLLGALSEWDNEMGNHRLLDVEQIRHWADRGIEFGAHTRSHAQLTSLSREQALREMRGSKEDLEQLTQRPVRAFAYPYGAVDDTARALAADVFDLAFTADEGANAPDTDPHLIRRTMVSNRDRTPDVLLRTRLGYSPREHIRGWAGFQLGRKLRDNR